MHVYLKLAYNFGTVIFVTVIFGSWNEADFFPLWGCSKEIYCLPGRHRALQLSITWSPVRRS